MARQARLIESGIAFHVTARGNYRQTVFFSEEDRAEYLDLLARCAAAEDLEILGWCLMTNHAHLLAVPRKTTALARTMRRTQADYAQRLNRRHGSRSGHLWQSRFYSCPVEGDAVWTVLRYIESNPVRASLIALAEQSPWSSAAMHCGLRAVPPLLSTSEWERLWTPSRWQSVLAHGAEERDIGAIRAATMRGLPLGDQKFVAAFERRSGRELVVRPVGRPRVGHGLAGAASPGGGTLSD
jgi:putative transposase